jgi:hypothetical protein
MEEIGNRDWLCYWPKEAIRREGGAAFDAAAVAQILGVHKRHAYTVIRAQTVKWKKESHASHKTITSDSQESHKTAQPDGLQKNMCRLCSVK